MTQKNNNVSVCALEQRVHKMEGKVAKFETLCGRTFDSSAALANFLGVTKGAISHAKSDAKEKGRAFFECGKPTKRFIRILETDESTPQLSEGDDTNGRFLHTDVLGNKMKRLHAQGYMQAAALTLPRILGYNRPQNLCSKSLLSALFEFEVFRCSIFL